MLPDLLELWRPESTHSHTLTGAPYLQILIVLVIIEEFPLPLYSITNWAILQP